MSNMSSAVGTMAITANSEKEVYGVMNALHDMLDGDNDYVTDFDIGEAVWVHPTFTPENPYKVTYEVEFHGTGRNTYEDNIYYMRYWLQGNRYLLDHFWKAKFDFSDEERGNRDLYQETMLVTHEAGESFLNMKFERLNYFRSPYTAYNLYRIMDYSSDYLEDLYGIEDDPEMNEPEEIAERKNVILHDAADSYQDRNSVPYSEAESEIIKILPWLAHKETANA